MILELTSDLLLYYSGSYQSSDLASESLNSGVQLLALYHDSLLSRALAQSLRSSPSSLHKNVSPHNRYTRFYCQKSSAYRRAATMLQIVQYVELLLEMLAKRRSERTRWRVVVVLESVKSVCRLMLLRLTNSRPLLTPPLPEREVIETPDPPAHNEFDEEGDPEHALSEAGSEQWTMPRTSLTLPPLPSADDISSYLLSRVLTADDVKPPPALLHRTAGLGELAEILFILRPVVYAIALAYWSQRSGPSDASGKHGRGGGISTDWRPWLLGISMEYGARQLARRTLETRLPGGARGLTQLERAELNKRNWSLSWWAMRGAFYHHVTGGLVRGVASRLKGKPLLDMVATFVEDYDFLWEQYYFPTATL